MRPALRTIVAVDLSITSTGLAAWRDGDIKLDTIRTSPRMRDEARWELIAGALFGAVGAAGESCLVVFEGRIAVPARAEIVDGKARVKSLGGDSHLDRAELRGVLRYGLYRRGVAYVDVHPSTLKVYATGNGRAGKDDMLLAAERRLGHLVQVRGNDQSDALWLLAAALDHYGAPLCPMPATHHKALTKPAWPDADLIDVDALGILREFDDGKEAQR